MSEEKMDNLQNADGNENLQENNPIEEAKKEATPKVNEDTKAILNEIDQENAEDAEDTENTKRHEIPVEDYEAMSLDGLVGELKKLLHNEKIQAIKKHTDAIRYEFDKKYADLLEEKKKNFWLTVATKLILNITFQHVRFFTTFTTNIAINEINTIKNLKIPCRPTWLDDKILSKKLKV